MEKRLEIVLERICGEIGWHHAEAWAADPRDDQVRMLACWHDGSPGLAEFAKKSAVHRLSPGTGLPGRVIHFGKIEVLEDLDSLPDTVFLRKAEALAAGLTSAVGVPVGTGGRTYAALLFFRADEPTDPRLASSIAAKSVEAVRISPRGQDEAAERPTHPLLRKLARFNQMAAADGIPLLECFGHARKYAAGEPLNFKSVTPAQVVTIETGWACVQRHLADGRRQVTHVLLPGDMVGLVREDPRDRAQEVRAITPVTANSAPLQRLDTLFESRPRVASAVFWMSLWEQSFLADRLTDIGRRSAFDRMAHFMLDIYQRLSFLDPNVRSEIDWPLTQETLADALGLSTVHVNRTLRALRDKGYVSITRGKLRIPDVEALCRAVDFDWSELYLYTNQDAFHVA